MRLLVTGGYGFIGSNFIRLLLAERPDWRVVNLDLLTYAGNPENLADVAPPAAKAGRYRHVRADVADADAVEKLLREERPEGVVHLAAESHVDRSIEDPAPFIHTNVLGTEVLLSAARRHGAGRFVMVSTDEVYGPLELDEPRRFTETDPLSPTSPYAASKAAADLLAQASFKTYGSPVLVTRCSNNYGPYQFPEKFLPLMITRALAGETLPVYGDGLYVRDWIHVEDHARGLLAALERGRPGEVYNLGGGAEKPNIEVVREILKRTGRTESLIERVADRPAHDRRYAIDDERSRGALGWAPKHDFETGLTRTISWYRDNQTWWRRIVSGDYLVDRKAARG
jgi:dTDP-glucose 4,6-dehydratase